MPKCCPEEFRRKVLDLVGGGVQRHGGGLGDYPVFQPQERLGQVIEGWPGRGLPEPL